MLARGECRGHFRLVYREIGERQESFIGKSKSEKTEKKKDHAGLHNPFEALVPRAESKDRYSFQQWMEFNKLLNNNSQALLEEIK